MKHIDINSVTKMSLFMALICVSALISIPISIISVPITLQLLVVIATGLFLKEKSVIIIILYIIVGLIGLPVFAYGGGIQYIFNLSFGYILAFIPMVLIIGITAKKTNNPFFILLSIFISIFICYIIGTTYMGLMGYYYWNYTYGIEKYIALGFIPYIIPDIIKGIIAYIIYNRVNHLM